MFMASSHSSTVIQIFCLSIFMEMLFKGHRTSESAAEQLQNNGKLRISQKTSFD